MKLLPLILCSVFAALCGGCATEADFDVPYAAVNKSIDLMYSDSGLVTPKVVEIEKDVQKQYTLPASSGIMGVESVPGKTTVTVKALGPQKTKVSVKTETTEYGITTRDFVREEQVLQSITNAVNETNRKPFDEELFKNSQ